MTDKVHITTHCIQALGWTPPLPCSERWTLPVALISIPPFGNKVRFLLSGQFLFVPAGGRRTRSPAGGSGGRVGWPMDHRARPRRLGRWNSSVGLPATCPPARRPPVERWAQGGG